MSVSLEGKFDLIVVGTGPGGEGAAMQAAKLGKKVAVVERFERIGGGCTHWGTIPSKALRFAIFQVTEANHNPLIRAAGLSVQASFPELRRSARHVIERQVEMRRGFYERNHVPIIHGQARFVDEFTIAVAEPAGACQRLQSVK